MTPITETEKARRYPGPAWAADLNTLGTLYDIEAATLTHRDREKLWTSFRRRCPVIITLPTGERVAVKAVTATAGRDKYPKWTVVHAK